MAGTYGLISSAVISCATVSQQRFNRAHQFSTACPELSDPLLHHPLKQLLSSRQKRNQHLTAIL
ncbi:MAG TPA: hypothetical protein VLL56_00705, partial [Terriglobia bacterium]|nr:hypothetical protein [Terriglobia bacterium]